MGNKILIIMHQATSTPGRIGMMLRDRGYELQACRPVLGDKLPETLKDYAGVIIFGGPMSVNDEKEYEGLSREIDWIKVPLKENVPFLGLCLGGQMLAKHLGATVSLHPEQYAEIGYYPISATKAGIDRFGDWPSHVYQWHRDGFELPTGAKLLATGKGQFPNQAFSYNGTAIGLQFHPEVTLAMSKRWTIKTPKERFALPGAKAPHLHFSDRLLYDAAVRDWSVRLLDSWLTSKPVTKTKAA